MVFKSKYKCEHSFVSNCGKKTSNIYKQEFSNNGKRSLIICGQSPTYDKIQTFAEDCNIYKIVSRYVGGDVSVIDKNKGFYADITSLPKTFDEFHNKVVEGQNIFNGLPTDLKQRFGNSINEFMHSIYDDTFESKYNDYLNSKVIKKYDSVEPVDSIDKDIKVKE